MGVSHLVILAIVTAGPVCLGLAYGWPAAVVAFVLEVAMMPIGAASCLVSLRRAGIEIGRNDEGWTLDADCPGARLAAAARWAKRADDEL